MSKKTSKFKLFQIKTKALDLRKNYQIPYKLMYYISKLDDNSSEEVVKFLLSSTEHLLRVKGYYRKFVDIEHQVNASLEQEMKSRFGS